MNALDYDDYVFHSFSLSKFENASMYGIVYACVLIYFCVMCTWTVTGVEGLELSTDIRILTNVWEKDGLVEVTVRQDAWLFEYPKSKLPISRSSSRCYSSYLELNGDSSYQVWDAFGCNSINLVPPCQNSRQYHLRWPLSFKERRILLLTSYCRISY